MTNSHYNFREDEIHIHYSVAPNAGTLSAKELLPDFQVTFTYFIANELNALNRQSSDTMAGSMARFLLNLKKKKIIKGAGVATDEKGKQKKKKRNGLCDCAELDDHSPNAPAMTRSIVEIIVASCDGVIVNMDLHSNVNWQSGMFIVIGYSSGEVLLSNSVGMHYASYIGEVMLKLRVVLNPPIVQKIKTYPSLIFNGSPVVCGVDATGSLLVPWYLKGMKDMGDSVSIGDYECECEYEYDCTWYISRSEAHSIIEGDYVYTGCNSAIFVPTVARDDGVYKLKVYCTPKVRIKSIGDDVYVYGRTVTHYVHCNVRTTPLLDALPAGFGLCTMSETMTLSDRVYSRAPSSGDSMVRVMSYNILSDCYCSKQFCNGRYDYLADEHIDFNYRCQLVYREIVELYRCPDVVALQEVDAKTFYQYFRPLFDVQPESNVTKNVTDAASPADTTPCILPQQHYYSHYTNKSGSTNEGCALLINSNVFELLAFVDLNLSECMKNLPEIQSLFTARPDVFDILVKRVTTIAQIAVCLVKSEDTCSAACDKIVVVANTHLFFHPAAEYVRLLQTYVITSQVQRIKEQLLAGTFVSGAIATDACVSEGVAIHLSKFALCTYQYRGAHSIRVACMYAGDFNSTSETPTIEFILKGELLANHCMWDSLHDFTWGRGGATTGSSTNSRTSSPIPASDICTDQGRSKGNKAAKVYVNPADHSQYHKLQVSQEVKDIDIADCIPKRLEHSHGNSCSAGSVIGYNNGWDARTDPTVGGSGCGLMSAHGFPLFTNYTLDFKDCLDYIFLSPAECMVVQVNTIPMASELYLEPVDTVADTERKSNSNSNTNCDIQVSTSDPSRVQSIPSQHHPSDHLPLLVDVVLLG